MLAGAPPIIVGFDGSFGSELALSWALDDASVRKARVQVVCCHGRPMTAGWESIEAREIDRWARSARDTAQAVVERALTHAAGVAPEVEVSGVIIDGHAADVLAERSAETSRIVLGSRQLKALGSMLLGSVGAGVAARAHCPVVVVRGPVGLAAEHPSVVVGIDGTDAAQPALEFGFEHASRHGVPLRAVMCWRPDPLATMQWRGEAPVPERAQSWLSETLATWQKQYPTVSATAAVIRDHPVSGLVAQSTAQHLLVMRSRSRHALSGMLLGSVTQGVLHHATCPVAIIPAAVE
jgi:nucleotide-binding universal stress UspA family protein